MVGTFGGLNTALSALRYQQVALDVSNNNIANVNTEGYVRRRAESGAVAAPDQPAMWSQYVGHGDGVAVQSVSRLVDPLLDARSRRENGSLSYLSTQQTILNRVETGVNEPGPNGLSAALLDLRSAFQNLVSDPGGAAARQVVLEKAGAVASAFKTQSDNVTTEMADQQMHAATAVQQVNDTATELARLNKTIRIAQVNKTDVGSLSDQRDLLALNLAKLTGAEVKVQPDGQYDVAVNGVALVTGDTARQLTASGTPTALAIAGDPVPAGVSGELGGVLDALNDTLPAYQKSLDDIATTFMDQMNAQHRAGKDLNGVAGGDLFTLDPADPAGSLSVAFTDGKLLAASSGGAKDGGNADALSTATTVGSDYAALVTSFGGTVASINRQTTTQQALTGQVDDEREQMAGVSLDEETVNMVAAQHAYEAASKVMTVLDSLLDTLINRTGVTH
ncbi:flagellar hook-associated protein 1 FlgK [Nocardioides terrae]|uniref:Flagellar hook-associated protein 1 n=1 Tax=Nocardioides terrae TaxID=574651 RepID=A0A1I1I833_9ACTN|nr:flagellar hook-associated protein FlgK [Nocardioides terrae]SFC32324.1 flagellar hook-associated protein 1 FlgK [Nocardioides terrae]